jgi:poly(glycerol-phosphate) alpha-glucosyltransferase
VPVKGQDVLIQAMAVLVENGIRVSLNLYGEGLHGENFEADLGRLVAKNNLQSQVSFRGFINNIPNEMRHHSAAICPSHNEPLGRVVFEAWDSSILPIVGRFSGGAAEVMIASGGGLLYDEQTPESLAKTMMECLALSPNEREEMIAKGRKWLKDNCDAREYSKKLLEILDEVAL